METVQVLCFVFASMFCVVQVLSDAYQDLEAQESAMIVAGWPARKNEVPFQVSLQVNGTNGLYHLCGGSVIDSEHILTAAHCVHNYSPEEIEVYAGVLNNSIYSLEATRAVFKVKNVVFHDGYNKSTGINDIAILRVSPLFPQNNPAVRSIRLRKDYASAGVKCRVSGWGRLDTPYGTSTQILQTVTVPLIANYDCKPFYKDYIRTIRPGMICAGIPNGNRGFCKGDSGGPLVCGGVLTGVVSWANGGCAKVNYPGVYADVVYFKQWIKDHLANT